MKLGVIGKGKAGSSLMAALRESGTEIAWWWSPRDGGSIEALEPADVILLAVADRAIRSTAERLAARPSAGSEVWLHLSGFHPGSLIRLSADIPRSAGCMHPLCALDGSEISVSHLEGCVAGIDGDDEAVAAARELSLALGMDPVRLVEGTKGVYHASAVTVAGHVTALFDRAAKALEGCGFDEDGARKALHRLLKTAVDNLEVGAPAEVLTGPVARGDSQVTEAHLRALESVDPKLAELYAGLAEIAAELVARS